jgi:hypothetical protein
MGTFRSRAFRLRAVRPGAGPRPLSAPPDSSKIPALLAFYTVDTVLGLGS